jgi:hypothetical protein
MRGCTCRGLTLCPQCAQLAARAGVIPPLLDSAHQLSEAAFMAAVVRLARAHGWTFAYHTYRSTKSLGGFPDLILCHQEPGHVCYAIELKTDTGQVTPAQAAWLEALAGCTGVVAECWRPRDLQEIVERLRG